MSHTPEPWKIEPCKCGGDGCHSWLIAEPIMTDSRMQKALPGLTEAPHCTRYSKPNPNQRPSLGTAQGPAARYR